MTSLLRTALLSFALCGCAANRPRLALPPQPATVDTLVLTLPYTPCPPVPACPKPPDPRWRDIPARADTTLWVALDSLARSEYLAQGGLLGAFAVRLGDTSPVWEYDPDARLLPASTQKVFTASAALSELGPAFRWRTTLWAKGAIHDSVLHGELILEGGGDPTLGMPDGTGLGGLVAAASRSGIRRVHGNLVALDPLVGRGPEAWPQGWAINSSRDGYGSPVLGLNWNQNRIGDHALPEPRPTALKALRKALAARGIQVLGSDTTVLVRGDSVGSRKNWTRLGTVSSPELEPVLRVCLRESVNPFAEAMVLGLGLGRRGPPRESGRKRIQEWLTGQGVDPTRMLADDGSGLSRYDMTSARQMVRLLAHDARRQGTRLADLLPRGGEGTLRRRFRNLPDPSLVAAKTGTLDGVSNLAGYLVRPGRDTLAFSFLCNGFAGSPRPVRLFQDRMLALLAGMPLRPVSASDTSDTLAGKPATDSVHLRPDPGKDSAFARGDVVDSGSAPTRTPGDTSAIPTSVRAPDSLVVPSGPKPASAAPGPLDAFPVRKEQEFPSRN